MPSTGGDADTATPAMPSPKIGKELKTREAAITVGVLFTVAVFALARLPPVPQLQLWLFDSFQQLMPRERVSSPAVIVEIDERSLSEFGQWPWPRTRTAELIDRIAAHEPAAIGLDMLFPEPDRMSPDRYADSLQQQTPKLAAQLRSYPSNDAILARAIARSHAVVSIAGTPEASPNLEHFVHSSTAQTVLYSPPSLPLPEYAGVLESVNEIQDAAAGRGFISWTVAKDNVVRTIPLVAVIGNIPVAILGLELLRVASKSQINVVQSGGDLVDVRLGSQAIAKAQANGEMWIRFGHRTAMTYVSAADVLAGRVDDARLKRRLVIVSVTALGLTNYVSTPLGESVPGGEIHAQLIEQLYDQTPLYRTGYSPYLETLAFVAVGLALAFVARYFSMAVTLAVLLACTVGAGLLGVLFYSRGILIDIVTPVVGWQMAYGCALATSLMIARKAHQKAVYMFSRFVNPHVVRELLRDDSFARAGQSRELTILFSDIRNFTALSERRSPAEVVTLLNEYFTRQVAVLFRHRGALDKFMGDGVMAFWGAPLDDVEHAKHAIDCALEMITAFDSFRSDMGIHDEDLNIGIGLHTGRSVVGLVGTEARREYTAIGATVNLASRVEQLTKVTKRRVLVSRETMEKCSSAFAFDYVGSFSVKGVERQVEVYEPRPR